MPFARIDFRSGRLAAALVAASLACWMLPPAALSAPAVELSPEEQAWLESHPVIRLAPDPDFRPIEYFDESGAYKGAAADIVRILERKLGVAITVVHLKNWDEVMDKFKRREVDLLGALVRTPAREAFALFTDTLLTVPGGIFSRYEGALTLDALRGKKVAVVSNYTAHEVLKSRYPGIALDVVPDVSTGLAKASLGMVDAYVENMANATFYSQEAGITNLRLAGTTDFDYRWSIGVRKDWPEAQRILNKGLAAIAEAEREEAVRRWFRVTETVWRPSRTFVLGSAAGLLGLLLLGSLFWNRALQKTRRRALSNEQRFKALFQNLGDPVYITDSGGRFVAANDEALRELGHTLEELLALSVADVAVAARPGEVEATFEMVRRTKAATFETVHRRRDGTTFPVEVNAREIDFDGKPAILGVARDLTERKRAETALEHSERLNAAVSRIAKAFVVGVSEEEVYDDILKTVLELTGSPHGVVGYVDEAGALVCPSMTGHIGFECQLEHKTIVFPEATWGDRFWGNGLRSGLPRCSNQPFRVPEGHVAVDRCLTVPLVFRARSIGLLTVANKPTDYTDDDLAALQKIGEQVAPILGAKLEKEAADRALREQAERLRLYFERMPLACIVWDTGFRATAWNPAAERIFEYSADEALGMTAYETIVPERARADVESVWKRLLRGELSADSVNENRTKTGRAILCQWTNTPLRDPSGAILGALSMVQDVTEQRRKEEEHRRLEQQMTHAQKLESLGVLAGGIAHDFNNILMSIVGNADLALLKVGPESPVVDHLHTIEKAAARAADLAKQMLAYSGKGKFVVESIDLNKLIQEMTHMLEVSITKKAVLRYRLAPSLPSLEADPTQLRQVVMNLVINASEAIGDKSGVIAVTTGCKECDEPYLKDAWLDEKLPAGLYVYLEVADTGCGMDKETMARIFDPFFTTKFTGRGLGLAALLGIVRGHRGAVKIHSEPGTGSTFRILLPAGGRPAVLLDDDGAPSDWGGSGRVLLVDDEETVRAVGRAMLETLGFEVLTAADGKEAVELYRSRRDIDLIVLDLTMPHMDGEQAYRELRDIDPNARVILSSGYSEQEVAQKFRGKELAGFIQKPYKLSTLREALKAGLVARA